jgi:hypothetical protein
VRDRRPILRDHRRVTGRPRLVITLPGVISAAKMAAASARRTRIVGGGGAEHAMGMAANRRGQCG